MKLFCGWNRLFYSLYSYLQKLYYLLPADLCPKDEFWKDRFLNSDWLTVCQQDQRKNQEAEILLSGDPDHLQVLQSLETVLLHGKKADIPLVILEAKSGTLESALFVLLQTATLQIL